MTLPEENSPMSDHTKTEPFQDDEVESRHHWDINDNNLPIIEDHDSWQEWPNGHCRYVYPGDLEDARRHSSGWAMRNTNNHNVNILKKSCLGVLVCSLHCKPENSGPVHLRPAICDKARKKQYGKQCPNPNCEGRLELQACRGHCGYPVTHFWRHTNGSIYFQAKGVHDHHPPELKASAEARRHSYLTKENRNPLMGERQRLSRKRTLYPSLPDFQPKFPRLDHGLSHMPAGVKDVICSCPPFECLCRSIPAFQTPEVYSQPQPNLSSPSMPATSIPTVDHRTFDSLEFMVQQQQWRDSYNEYFDMSHETKVQPPVCLADQFGPSSSFVKPEYSFPLIATPTSTTPSVFDFYDGSKMAHDLFKNRSAGLSTGSDCMYSSEPVVAMSSPEHHTNSHLHSPVKGMLPCASPELGTLPSAGATVTPVCLASHTTTDSDHCTTYSTAGMSSRTLDDFEINDAGDILSLDQPINKAVGSAPPRYSCQRRAFTPERDNSTPPMPAAPGLSSLLELPSITSFLMEENETTERTPNEHVDRILGLTLNYGDSEPKPSDVTLSPASSCDQKVPSDSGSLSPCQRHSSPSLIELQPVHSSKGGVPPQKKYDMASALKQTDILSSQTEKGAFHPYVDHLAHKDNIYSGSAQYLHSSKFHHDTPHDSLNYYHGDIMQYPTSSASVPSLTSYTRHNHNINITLSY